MQQSSIISSGFKEVPDHFNYPMPNRKDLMSNNLNSIKDVTHIESRTSPEKRETKFRSTSLFTGDISGARSEMKPYQYTNKQCFINKNDDIIDKKKLKLMERPSSFLNHRDLPGNRSQRNKFKTGRISNPICPSYPIQAYVPVEPAETKFIKDPLNIDDIEGTRAKKDFWHNYERNFNPYTEIKGSKPRIPAIYKDKHCSLQVNDIVKDKWKSERNSDPLQPEYFGRITDDNIPQKYGFIKGTLTSPQLKDLNKEKDFSLKTKDIIGAQANYCVEQPLLLKTRSQFRNTNLTNDIKGSQVGTLLKHIKTSRQINPLEPLYQNPGHTEKNDFYQDYFTKEEKFQKLHSRIENNKSEIHNKSVQQQQNESALTKQIRRPSTNSHQSKRSVRSNTSNALSSHKPTVAQQLDNFLGRK